MALVTKSFSDIITFTRTSNATQFNSAGTLVYAPHNLILDSEDWSTASWSRLSCTFSYNVDTAPNGTLTADLLIPNNGSILGRATQTISTLQDFVPVIFSVYVKSSGLTNLVLTFTDKAGTVYDSQVLNSETGVLSGTVAAGTTTTAVLDGSNWYRLIFSVNSSASGATTPSIVFRCSNTGDGTNGVLLWGAQLNVAALQSYNQTTSSAYYGPRFDYNPSTLAARGLLIEESRTNNLIWSDSFRARQLNVTVTAGTFQDGETVTATGGGVGTYVAADSTATSFAIYNLTVSSAWTGTLTGSTSGATATINSVLNVWTNGVNTTVTRNSQTAPDGTTTADTMAASTVGIFSRTTHQEYTTSTQGAWTFSLFVKKGTLTNNLIAIRVRDSTGTNAFWANFNLSTLATPTIFIDGGLWVAGTATVTPCQDGWVRISVSGTTNTVTTFYRTEIWLGGYQNVAETIGTAFVWGAQFEAGAFPTSYIPTTTTALTRNRDEASVNTLSPWYNAAAGTLFAESVSSVPSATLSGAIQPNIVFITDGTSNNRIGMFYNTGNVISGRIVTAGATANPADISANLPSVNRSALAYAVGTNQGAVSVNASAVTTSSPAGLPVVDRMTLGAGTIGIQLNGYLRRITYYPRRLSNAELQAITV